MDNTPRISLVMPVYNPPEPFFGIAVRSVLEQDFTNWELCMADDASPDASVWPRLQAYAAADRRIKICRRQHNGHISLATNSAATAASGDFLAFLDQDDALTPHCLSHLVRYLVEYPDTDLLYTDDDKIDQKGLRYAEQFKQDFDPFQLLSFMTMGHILCVRRSLYEKLGGFRAEFVGAQDYDFALRASEVARHVGHVPAIAYHWRSLPGSTALGGGEKAYSFDAGLRAVQEALNRRGVPARAVHPEWARESGCGLFGIEFSPGLPVTVIMPVTADDPLPMPEVLAKIIAADYPQAVFILAVDSAVSLPNMPSPLHIIRLEAASKAALCNAAAQAASTPLLVFLSPTLVPHNGGWLRQMAGWAGLPGVACVGGKIYRSDGMVLHAGYLHGLEEEGLPGRVEFGRQDSWGHHFRLVTPNRCSAVSELCLATGREIFLAATGLDENTFPNALSGADFGYRLAARNMSCVFCPEARFTCLEPEIFMTRDTDAEHAFKRRHLNLPRAVNPHIAYGTGFAFRPYRIPDFAKKTLQVLMVSHGLALEGAPKTLQELTAGLSSLGKIKPQVWSHTDGPLRHVYTEAGISVSVLPCASPNAPPGLGSDLDIYVHNNLAFLPMADEEAYDTVLDCFARDMADQRVDVLVANTILAFWAVEAAARADIPCLWMIRESEKPFLHLEGLPPFIRYRAERQFAVPYRTVFVAKATRKIFSDYVQNNNALVIHNALAPGFIEAYGRTRREDTRAELGIGHDETVVLLLGSVFERKGQMDVAEACARLDESLLKKIRFLIVGDRPGTLYSIKLHQALGALSAKRRQRVLLIPEIPRPEVFYRAADIFLCCSRIESFPRVILEAMHCSLPIITTPVFGIREQVREAESALFYKPGDIAGLCRHIALLANDPELRCILGVKAREALKFLPDYDAWLSYYETLLFEAASSD
ncbi:MAG: glycosyltransferase [Desulfarculales bacterium]|jgi:glycosyltransferase involved in cell wall biosynthesis|nr:glycosyltransferase [Desulfarculales bacterium]